LAVGLAAVATELGIPPAAPSTAAVNEPPGTVYSFNAIDELHDALDRTYRLGVTFGGRRFALQEVRSIER